MEVIGNYEYYAEYALILCVEHSCAISPDSIDHHIELDLKGLSGTLRKEKKAAYFVMMARIKDTLLPLDMVTRNINSKPPIPPFSSLVAPISAYHCVGKADCPFVSRSLKMVERHIGKDHPEKKNFRQAFIEPAFIQYLTLTKSFIISVNSKFAIQGTFLSFFYLEKIIIRYF